MKLSEVIDAYRAVAELSRCVLPYKAARRVAMLKKALQAEFDVIAAQESALTEQYGGEKDGSGTIRFADAEKGAEFAAQWGKYLKEETEAVFPGVDISKYADQLRISPDAICALEGLVDFGEE